MRNTMLALLITTPSFFAVGASAQERAGMAAVASEQASALYFAPPESEAAEPAVTEAELTEAGAVELAMALGKIEEGLGRCQTTRREMQAQIGNDYGSYSVNPGWLRRYQDCVVRRAAEARMVGDAITDRQTALLARLSDDGPEVSGDDAQRAADLMARLATRQSDVKRAIRDESEMQKAFVRYYNTGDMPAALANEADAAARVARPPAPVEEPLPVADEVLPATDAPLVAPPADEPTLQDDIETGEGEYVPPAPDATNAPVPLREPN